MAAVPATPVMPPAAPVAAPAPAYAPPAAPMPPAAPAYAPSPAAPAPAAAPAATDAEIMQAMQAYVKIHKADGVKRVLAEFGLTGPAQASPEMKPHLLARFRDTSR
jgi:hypothetical protein